MALPTDVTPGVPADPASPWIPAGPNHGYCYIDRIRAADLPPAGAANATARATSIAPATPTAPARPTVASYYAARYPHSDAATWRGRLQAGEIHHNGQQLRADGPIAAGDRLQWHRPPWWEPAVPVLPQPLYDDGDLLVFDKPQGLPVLPAGGFLEHTLLRQLEHRHGRGPSLPRPVHRLGRFTSGLLVCARRSSTRAWLSAQLRESTNAAPAHGAGAGCSKVYRALVQPGLLPLAPGDQRLVTTPIGQRPHRRLGQLWCAVADGEGLPSRSVVRLLSTTAAADLVEVTIASGRPHQIRIHCAALGAPLLGDPLFLPGGLGRDGALPGDGGYHLHAFQLRLAVPQGGLLALEAPPPARLRLQGEAGGPPA